MKRKRTADAMNKLRFMSKLVSMILAIMVFFSISAHADTMDISSLSDEELLNLAGACFSELGRRHTEPAEISYQNEELGILVSLSNLQLQPLHDRLMYTFTVINDSDSDIHISIEDVYVNGWGGLKGDGTRGVNAHKRDKGLVFQVNNLKKHTDLDSLDNVAAIKQIEFQIVITVYEPDSAEGSRRVKEKVSLPFALTDMSIIEVYPY